MKLLALAEVQAFVEAQAAALDREAARNPFATAAWLRCYLPYCAEPGREYAVVGNAERGWTLLERRGGEWCALHNYYASQFSPWAGARAQGGGAARWPGPVVNLDMLDEASAQRLEQEWVAQGWWTRRYDCFANWVLPCADLRFADFLAQRPGALANTLRRKQRRFERAGARARLQIVERPDELPAALDAYEQVYARSWKQAEPYPRFIRAWAQTCAERGWLRLGLAWVDGQPVAAQFWFTIAGRACIFKLAYDEAWREWSAGTLLSGLLFERALDVDRVQEIDYLSGDDAYKSDWMSERRRRVGVVACNPRHPLGLWRGGKEKLGAWTAHWRSPAAQETPA